MIGLSPSFWVGCAVWCFRIGDCLPHLCLAGARLPSLGGRKCDGCSANRAPVTGCSPLPHRIPLTKFTSTRRMLTEVGSEIPDMNAITQFLKFKLGFSDLAEPTPEILKNYMDVSTQPCCPGWSWCSWQSCATCCSSEDHCQIFQLLNIIKKLKIISMVPLSCWICCSVTYFLPSFPLIAVYGSCTCGPAGLVVLLALLCCTLSCTGAKPVPAFSF